MKYVWVILLCVTSGKMSAQPFKRDSINLANAKTVPVNLNAPAPNYYSKNIGIFCKYELLMDKELKVPVRFRLGSMDYCNYLEQKPNYKYYSK